MNDTDTVATFAPTLPTRMFVALRLMTYIGTSMGIDIKIRNDAHGCLGVLPVFNSKDAAENWYGVGVEVSEIQCIDKPGKT